MAPPLAPPCHCEFRFHPSRDWRFDFAFPEHKLAVEIDGGQWQTHGGRHSRDSDREKLNQAAVLGWRVMHYSGSMLDDPERVVAEIMHALEGFDAVDV
jgi:very-short-patch-repair endonuclease